MWKGGQLVPDPMTHELALGFRVRGKGLVVITSCAHAGVIHSVEHLRRVTGEARVAGLVGGMHLTSASDDVVEKTVEALAGIKPTVVAPMHCTGDRALARLRTVLPAAYVHPSVGTVYRFEGAPSP
jgi:7,8-dihydropterin-6-yl-methyl-4-(beta-D-ribofuranosyl)aminobenzene 5'-phosphate synthase